jgi:hypothetical protein
MGANSRERKETLQGPQTLIPYFQGFGAGPDMLGGAELEIFLMRRAADGFERVSDYENFKLVEALKYNTGPYGNEPATPVSQEPEASQIETQSRAHRLGEIHFIGEEIAAHRASILRRARELEVTAAEREQVQTALTAQTSLLRPPSSPLYKGNLVACPFAIMPFSPRDAALVNIISARGHGQDYSDRPRIMVEAIQSILSREASKYPVSNIAVHFTHGARTMRHAFEMTRLQAALLPFFMVLTENRPPYAAESAQRILHHTGLKARLSLSTKTTMNAEQRGLLPDFMFAARDEHDFLNRMLDTVLNAPLLAYYDHEGNFKPAPRDERITPLSMNGLGPENVAQFELAMSEFWWSFKYKLPRGFDGLFHELRDFDSGPEVVNNIALIGGMLALNDAARHDMINRLERKYGIPLLSDPETARRIIRQNLHGAYHRGNPKIHPDAGDRHMLIPFGARGDTMLDFLRADLLPMLELQYRRTAAADKLSNLRFVAQTGMTNTQLWYDTLKSPEQMRRAVYEMTAPGSGYNSLSNQTKSWAQHYDDGHLPMLRLNHR